MSPNMSSMWLACIHRTSTCEGPRLPDYSSIFLMIICSFSMSFYFSLPWDDESFVGWFYGLLCSFWMSGTYFFMNCIFLSCFLSIGFNFDAFPKHFNHLLSQINAKKSQDVADHQQTRIALFWAIDFHNSIKKCVHRWDFKILLLFSPCYRIYAGFSRR